MMKKPHKNAPHVHAEFIKAWADGAEIEFLDTFGNWRPIGGNPQWFPTVTFRIKPEPKPDYVYFATFDTVKGQKILHSGVTSWKSPLDSLKLVFDSETGELKSAEVL